MEKSQVCKDKERHLRRKMKSYYMIIYCVLSALSAYALTGPVTDRTAVNRTLKLCNEKPLECKFKYDMVMYQETGRVPYTQPTKDKTK